MDFKWTLSRPGISLEFETGSVKEAIGLLEEEGTQISEMFGFALPAHQVAVAAEATAAETAAPDKPAPRRGRPPKAAVEAIAPDPIPVPTAETAPPLVPAAEGTPALPLASPPLVTVTIPAPNATTVLPPNQLAPAPAVLDIPADLDRRAELKAPPPPPLPVSAPPVGFLGPKMVLALQAKAATSPDGGQALADWLAAWGLTIKGKNFEDACRAVVMIADDKLKDAATQLGVI